MKAYYWIFSTTLLLTTACKITLPTSGQKPVETASPTAMPSATPTPTPAPGSSENQPPSAASQSAFTVEDQPKNITLTGSDPEAATLSYSLLSSPAHGTLSGTAPNLVYYPSLNYHGTDSFKFRVDDGSLWSADAVVNLTIEAVNDAPIAIPASLATEWNDPIDFNFQAEDVDIEAVSFEIVEQPSHGAITTVDTKLRFTPTKDYIGNDVFKFRAFDGKAYSAPAEVKVAVGAPEFHILSVDYPVETNEVKVESIAKPVVLAICNRDSMKWNFDIAAGTRLKRIYLCGNRTSTLLSLPSTTEVVDLPSVFPTEDIVWMSGMIEKLEQKTGLKSNSTQASYYGGNFIVHSVPNLPLPEKYEVHYVSINSPDATRAPMMPVEVTVDREVPVVLVLASKVEVEWKIVAKNGSKIAKVICLNGNNPSSVTGAPINALRAGYYWWNVPYTYPSNEATFLINDIAPLIGPDPIVVDSFQAAFIKNSFLIQ